MPHTDQTLAHIPDAAEILPPLKPALLKGWRGKCPKCGSGPLLKSYLKVHGECAVCGEDFTLQRADDGPAYLTILVVGHLMIPLMHISFVKFRPEPLTLFTIFALGTTALTLYLHPKMKGAVIGFQWARRMHGFGVQK